MFKKIFEKISGEQAGKKAVVEKPMTWEQLYDAISSDLQRRVEAVRRREIPITSLTREQNLRDTVRMLLIREAKDFEGLFETLDFAQSLQGSDKTYLAKDLKFKINTARRAIEVYPMDPQDIVENLPVLKSITRACGLRDKVVELFRAGNK
ncbi:hypothetical protein HY932_00635 [Candidatus Falkowbacteria bacterium]|nr:hypothetical protein [Candidatus Falkowbacteria bacterium]